MLASSVYSKRSAIGGQGVGDGGAVDYRLRPNKGLDRELFLSLLTRLAGVLKLENYQYIGLGGPFLEDFRLIHARIGMSKMFCIESDETVHARQQFNRPFDSVACVHSTLEDFLERTFFEEQAVIWFDYTEPSSLVEQIDTFCRFLAEVPIGSVLRLTVNANPSSLGDAPAERTHGDSLLSWRLEQFEERIGRHFLQDIRPEDMTRRRYGWAVSRVVKAAVESAAADLLDRSVAWLLSTVYADGQQMVTATLAVTPETGSLELEQVLKGWEFASTPENPLLLDVPSLSARERLFMEQAETPDEELGFPLPPGKLDTNPFETFRRFYRVLPHFTRVEL